MSQNPINLFQEGSNCWRIATASHASMVVDAEDYYRALHEGIRKAKHSVFIFGWNVDGRIPLVRGDDVIDGYPSTLHELIVQCARANPDLEFYINQWGHPFLLAGDREFLPAARWRAENCPNIHFRFDNIVPLQASQHQKIVVIDDAIAYSGGLDIGTMRWDNRRHHPADPLRQDFNDNDDKNTQPYIPNHDVQMVVSGQAAKCLAELARKRWFMATDYEAIPIRPYQESGLPNIWPSKNPPQFENIEIAISLTFPSIGDKPAYRQIENLYMDLIQSAEKFIYIENQYLANNDIAKALNRALKKNKNLRVLILSSRDPNGLAEEVIMWSKRILFKRLLRKGSVKDRVAMVYTLSMSDNKSSPVHIHSKVMIVDDTFLQIGSANINDRSMYLDSECDITVIGQDQQTRDIISDLRNDLIEEHCGRKKDDTQALIDDGNPISFFLSDVSGSPRSFKMIKDNLSAVASFLKVIVIAEARKRPVINAISEYFSSYEDKAGFPHKRASMNFLIIVTMAIFLYFDRPMPLSDGLNYQLFETIIENFRTSSLPFLTVIGIFILGGLVFVPITMMLVMTGAIFGVAMGIAVAIAGVIASAAMNFLAGAIIRPSLFQNYANTAFMRIQDRVKNGDIFPLAALRMVPIVPFSLANFILGARKTHFIPYLWSTFLGMLPSIVAMVVFGDAFFRLWQNPNPENLVYVGAALVIWIGMLIFIHVFLKAGIRRPLKESIS